MSGPTKRSNAHLKAIGSRKVHHGEDVTPLALVEIPKPPAILDEVGRDKWSELCGLLIEQEILCAWDLGALESLCLEYSRYVSAVKETVKNGEFFQTKTGFLAKSPASVVRNQAFVNYTKLLKRFGGDTQARANLKRVKPQQEKTNPFATV